MSAAQIPFALATASISGSPLFPLVILDDEAAIALASIAPLAAKLGHALSGAETLHDLLQDWSRNLAALQAAVMALDDAALGKYARSSVTALEFFDLHAPLAAPRQVFVDDHMRPATTLAGPQAKVPMPVGTQALHAGFALVVVIGAPTYQASPAEAAAAIAGFAVATCYRSEAGETWAPAFLPTGPMMVPAEFVDSTLSGRISFNGETGYGGTINRETAIQSVRATSARAQLFPGDLILCPIGETSTTPLGDGDIIETAIAGLGRQTTNIMVESKHAHPRD